MSISISTLFHISPLLSLLPLHYQKTSYSTLISYILYLIPPGSYTSPLYLLLTFNFSLIHSQYPYPALLSSSFFFTLSSFLFPLSEFYSLTSYNSITIQFLHSISPPYLPQLTTTLILILIHTLILIHNLLSTTTFLIYSPPHLSTFNSTQLNIPHSPHSFH
jgi:hypothetical protein